MILDVHEGFKTMLDSKVYLYRLFSCNTYLQLGGGYKIFII